MTPGRPTLSIVVPAYNESERLAGSLKLLEEHLGSLNERSEILVVDDGSSDDTFALVRRLAPSLRVPVRVVRYGRNRGKGHALRVGFAEARGDRVVFTDADLSVPLEFLDRVVALLDQGFDLAIGSRRGEGAEIVEHQPWLRELLGKIFTHLVRRVISNVSDATCGFKGFRAEVGKDLFSRSRLDDWSFDAEILWLARQRGCRIAELPVRWTHREGSKVRPIRAGMASLAGLIRIRWYGLTGAYSRSRPVGVETESWPPGTESGPGYWRSV
jgi:dolichyl-phosphate beta-glucosyltransferase